LAPAAFGQGAEKFVRARMSGDQEAPAVSAGASGEFRAMIDPADTQRTSQLQYSGLEGTVIQARIHLGARGANGGVSIFLCGSPASPGPPGTPTCPQEGSVSRTVTAADVIGPSGQGIAPGEPAEIPRARRAGASYANVHTTKWPGGEIRGQIQEEN
jgi:hypothetical protein